MGERVHLTVEGPIATITNDNPDKHNAFDDDMDARLFEILAELRQHEGLRAVIWRGEGKSFSSGRDVGSIGNLKVELSHHELMRRGHRGIQQLWDLDAPVIVACKGWVMGGSFQRALLCDLRIAAEALGHGFVSRVVPGDELDATVREIAEQIAAAPAVTVKMAREVIRHLAVPQIRQSMTDEMIYQTFINKSDDIAELRAARADEREPRYTGS